MNMDYEDSLLYGIQKIPGKTAAEKYKYINVTAKEIAKKICSLEDLPVSLQSLMTVEVAKMTNQTNYMAEALRTSDALLCSRVLQVQDLFPNQDNSLLDWDYFNNELLSRISLTTRSKLIKKVSQDLEMKDPKYANTFYSEIVKQYGQIAASPLLLACSESFLSEQVTKNHLTLPPRHIPKLYAKYPDFIVSYLLNLPTKVWNPVMPYITILLDNHYTAMIEFIEKHSPSTRYIKFGKRRTKAFLKRGTQLLIEKADTYLPMLSLSILSSRLSDNEFSSMLSKSLPAKMGEFKYIYMIEPHLQYMSTKKRVLLTKEAFRKAYGKKLIECPDQIEPQFLAILPIEERVKVARLKIEKDSSWNFSRLESAWRAYLPFRETFDLTKSQIEKLSDAQERQKLINLMIFNCGINKDKGELLEMLKYLKSRHKNAQPEMIVDMINGIDRCFDLCNLDQSHWDILVDLIKRLVKQKPYEAINVLSRGIAFKVQNNLELDEYIHLYLTINSTNLINFNYFNDTLEMEGKVMQKIIDMMEEFYTKDRCDEYANKGSIVDSLFSSINCYNCKVIDKRKEKRGKSHPMPKRNRGRIGVFGYGEFSIGFYKNPWENINHSFFLVDDEKHKLNNKMEQKNEYPNVIINLENHPRFVKFVEETVIPSMRDGAASGIRDCTHAHYPHLLVKWFPPSEIEQLEELTRARRTISFDDVRNLKRDYSQVLSDLPNYYKQCSRNMPDGSAAVFFVKTLRWYNDLPIEFVRLAVEGLKVKYPRGAAQILAILVGGSKFEKLIDPLIPNEPSLDMQDDESMQLWSLITSCLEGVKLANPAVSLTLLRKLFSSDYMTECRKALHSVACRIPIPTVIKFASELVDERVAISKEMIHLLSMVAPRDQKCKFCEQLLSKKRHSSIHGVTLKQIFKMFLKDPKECTWNLLEKGLRITTIEDPKILEHFSSFEITPNEYVIRYVKEILAIFDQVSIEGYPELREQLKRNVLDKLENENMSKVLPTDFQKALINKYIFESYIANSKAFMKISFIFDVFLRNDSINEKLNFLRDWFDRFNGHLARTGESKKRFTVSPVNRLFRQIVIDFVHHQRNADIRFNATILNALQELFTSISNPMQDSQSYLYLEWLKAFQAGLIRPEKFGVYVGTNMHAWINLYGPAYFVRIKEFLSQFLQSLYRIYFNCESFDISSFIDGLVQTKTEYGHICAALFMHDIVGKCDRYDDFVEQLQKTENIMLQSLLYEKNYCLS